MALSHDWETYQVDLNDFRKSFKSLYLIRESTRDIFSHDILCGDGLVDNPLVCPDLC